MADLGHRVSNDAVALHDVNISLHVEVPDSCLQPHVFNNVDETSLIVSRRKRSKGTLRDNAPTAARSRTLGQMPEQTTLGWNALHSFEKRPGTEVTPNLVPTAIE